MPPATGTPGASNISIRSPISTCAACSYASVPLDIIGTAPVHHREDRRHRRRRQHQALGGNKTSIKANAETRSDNNALLLSNKSALTFAAALLMRLIVKESALTRQQVADINIAAVFITILVRVVIAPCATA